MDAVAAAAGVGKGTVFRVFGSRDGLLDALWTWKLSALRQTLETGGLSQRPDAPPGERVVGFLDALLTFKLENRHIIRARELTPGLLRSDHYRWMHGVLKHLIIEGAGGITAEDATYVAYALLAALHIDLIEELIAGGSSLDAIRSAQAAHARAVVASLQVARTKTRNESTTEQGCVLSP